MTVNNYVDKITSPLIPDQFPAFYEDKGPNFIAFVQSYYKWLEQYSNTYVGSTTYQTRSLANNFNVDETANNLIKLFSDQYLVNFPQDLAIEHPFIIKHILDFYRAKGTSRGIELLFRILYNLDSRVNFPGEFMLRASNGTWKLPRYIETTDSPYLSQLIGLSIKSSSGATAVVETVNQKIVNNRFVNIIYISSLIGDFRYGDFIYSDSLPGMVGSNAPLIIGSLTTVSIDNGGADFNVGDEVQIIGTGTDGLARVSAVTSENGKVIFTLIDGGYGYSLDASITIDNTGTGGTGASFTIGGITDVRNISLNTDTIDGIIATQLDLSTSGDVVSITGTSGAFVNGEGAIGYAWTRNLQVSVISDPLGYIANGESLSNTTLGIANLVVYISDGQQLYCTSNSTNINNANIVNGIFLISNTSQAVVQVVNAYDPVVNTFANGIVIGAASNSTVLTVDRTDGNDIGYYVTGMTVTGNSSGATATVVAQTRLTNWDYFPLSTFGSNLDTELSAAFSVINKQIGRITFLSNENPGDGYSSSPNVSIIEPFIYDLRIPDGSGGYWGADAIVDAEAGSANGIATALTILNSGFGYQPNEPVTLFNANNETVISGKAVVLSTGIGEGSWIDTQSFLSDVRVLQDSYYYQVFSYEIATEKTIDAYQGLVKELVHPVGYALFGKFAINREFANVGGKLLSSNVYQLLYTSKNIETETYYDVMTEANSYILVDGSF